MTQQMTVDTPAFRRSRSRFAWRLTAPRIRTIAYSRDLKVVGGDAQDKLNAQRLVDCNSETGSDPAGRRIVTVTDSLGLESFTISRARYQYYCYRPLV
jgi:hypothetical protein